MVATYFSLFTIDIRGKDSRFPAYWVANPTSALRHCSTLDLTVQRQTDADGSSGSRKTNAHNDPKPSAIYLDSKVPWCNFIASNLQRSDQPGTRDDVIAIKFILPQSSGFCIRSDLLRWRLASFDSVVVAQDFLTPRQEITPVNIPDGNSLHAKLLPQILSGAIGAILVKNHSALVDLEHELDNRLSFLWISPSCPPLRRVAWARGRYNMDHSRRIWEAAKSLGLALVIIDNEGHWLQDTKWAHLREGFIATNLDADEGLVDRLISAIRGYGKPIHGITTVSNKRMVAVSKACEKLGLPTEPSESFVIASDKYRSRELELDLEITVFRVQDVCDLENRLSNDFLTLQYPMVVKPCIGWGSECVSKVYTEAELIQAVERASERHRTSPIQRGDVMVESYIEGPEIDANVVLSNGEIIFFEIADDFPSLADKEHNKWTEPFQETYMVFPSRLPQDEIDIVRRSLQGTLIRQGFKNGVFNCEGRVRNSRMRYGVSSGMEDLVEDKSDMTQRKTPTFYLHEINARPPGYYGAVASNLTYGVDYYALNMLQAVGDMERYYSLAQPFMRGPQWWLVIAMIPEQEEGIMKTEDACTEFLRKFEDIKVSVADYMTWKRGGSRLQGQNASQLSFVGFFSVFSRKGRQEALKLANRIRREFTYELE
ncbi:glutathione synthetase ATP-binding domain-like protein [Daldinia eschscholtzii]|nr:glutathione synthetase ATP-binding domain-like protein [Daldinia eschscholtzii]